MTNKITSFNKYQTQNIEGHPSYEDLDLEINSNGELKESLDYIREDVEIKTKKELEKAKKIAKVTDSISSLIRAREYGLKTGDFKLAQNAESKLEKLIKKLPDKKVLFSGWYENGVNSLLEGIEEYDQKKEDKTSNETIYLVNDRSIQTYCAGHSLIPFGTCVGEYAYYESEKEDFQILKEAIKRPITEHPSKLVQDFWKHVETKVDKRDIETTCATGGRKYVSMKRENALNYLKDFLKERGYSLKRIDSYDKLPFALDHYIELSGSIGWHEDKKRILKNLTTFNLEKLLKI